jgi:hypothetical protein
MLNAHRWKTVDSTGLMTPVQLATNPSSGVLNGQSPGIGRLDRIEATLAINNLGRNIEIATMLGDQLRTSRIFDHTDFPGQDDASQFDLDVHSFLNWNGLLVAVNHFGLVRVYDRRQELSPPKHTFKMPGDVEVVKLVADRLICSSPGGYAVNEPALPGILVSQPLRLDQGELSWQRFLEDWGVVRALACSDDGRFLCVSDDERIGLFSLTIDAKHCLLTTISEVPAAFVANWATFDSGHQNFVLAGYDHPKQHHDLSWDSLGGGGFLCAGTDGTFTATRHFQADLAWGNGCVPLVLKGSALVGVDKFATLHGWDLRTGNYEVLSKPFPTDTSLGIAHAALYDDWLLAGFNRGGYYLYGYNIAGI